MAINILTRSGGEINLIPSNSGIRGAELYLHVDQTANINNGDDECTIALNLDECKSLILLINEYVAFREGKNYVAVIDHTNKNGDGAQLPINPDNVEPFSGEL
jgi:hypothetical protein